MIPVLRLLKVVYRLNLFSINSILILTLPFVFFPGLRPEVGVDCCPWPQWPVGSSLSESSSPSERVGSTCSKMKLSGGTCVTPGPFAVAKPEHPFKPVALFKSETVVTAPEWLLVCILIAKGKYPRVTTLFYVTSALHGNRVLRLDIFGRMKHRSTTEMLVS